MKPAHRETFAGSPAGEDAEPARRGDGGRIGRLASICLLCLMGVLVLVARHMSEVEPQAATFVPMAPAVVSTAMAQAQEFKQRHARSGVTCATCHGSDFSAAVPVGTCLACHGSYAALAELTRQMVPNPHAPHHLGEVRCGQCHREHQTSVLFCNRCHIFDMEVP